MSKKIDFETFVKRSKDTHPNSNLIYDSSTYKNTHIKTKITCTIHGDFWQTPKDHMNGQGCPECGKNRMGLLRRSNTDEFVAKYRKIYGDNNLDFSQFTYTKSNEHSNVICLKHGLFTATPNNLLNGRGCPECGLESRGDFFRMKEEEFDKRLKEIWGDKITYDFNDYKNFVIKMKFCCEKHGEFEALPLNILRGHGCPKCAIEKQIERRTTSYEQVEREMRKTHGNKYIYYPETYKNKRQKMKMECPKHGVFWQSPSAHIGGNGCRCCNESKLERELAQCLVENNIEFEREKKLGRQHIDFYIPAIKLNIECQGEQHFKKKFDDKYDFELSLQRDIKKHNLLKEQNEKLIYYTQKNLLPRDIKDKKFQGIYNDNNLYFDLDTVINYIKKEICEKK